MVCQGLYHIWLILCQHSGKMRMCHPATRIGFFVRPSPSPLLHHGFSAEYGGYRALSGRKKRIARPAHGRNLSVSSKKPRLVRCSEQVRGMRLPRESHVRIARWPNPGAFAKLHAVFRFLSVVQSKCMHERRRVVVFPEEFNLAVNNVEQTSVSL